MSHSPYTYIRIVFLLPLFYFYVYKTLIKNTKHKQFVCQTNLNIFLILLIIDEIY